MPPSKISLQLLETRLKEFIFMLCIDVVVRFASAVTMQYHNVQCGAYTGASITWMTSRSCFARCATLDICDLLLLLPGNKQRVSLFCALLKLMHRIMSLPPPRHDPRNNIPCGIIARLGADHDPSKINLGEIRQAIIQHLFIYIEPHDVSYLAPNFVIYVVDPLTQVQILSDPVIPLEHSFLELLPWSKELEWAQIPWITGNNPQILIEPLTILPVTPMKRAVTATHRLNEGWNSTKRLQLIL